MNRILELVNKASSVVFSDNSKVPNAKAEVAFYFEDKEEAKEFYDITMWNIDKDGKAIE